MDEYLKAMIKELCLSTHDRREAALIMAQIRDHYLDIGDNDVARCLGFMEVKGLRPSYVVKQPPDRPMYRWYKMTNSPLWRSAYCLDFINGDIFDYFLQKSEDKNPYGIAQYLVTFDTFEEAVLFLLPVFGSEYEGLP